MNSSALKVNADYEAVLFGGNPAEDINQTIEFLAFFLEQKPLLSSKNYPADYLLYVERVSGHRPQVISKADAVLWWGKLEDIKTEQLLNSKITSTKLMMKEGWCDTTAIIYNQKELSQIKPGSALLIKDPYSMSGRGFISYQDLAQDGALSTLQKKLEKTPLIAEPLLDRKHDFSHYIFTDGSKICYQNLVDSRFQYKGTVFTNWKKANVEQLPFYSEIGESEWQKFEQALTLIQQLYSTLAQDLKQQMGFSVDSFTYLQESKLKIRYLSEVNFRRTMGLVAYQLSQTYAKERSWSSLLIEKSFKGKGDFAALKKRLHEVLLTEEKESGVIILSPGNSRFEMFYLCAENAGEGEKLQLRLQALLANT